MNKITPCDIKTIEENINKSTERYINPEYYKNESSIECIDAMVITFGRSVVMKFCLCNAYKYIWRHKNKNNIEDIQKANWYLNWYSDHIVNDIEKNNITYIELLKYLIRISNDKGLSLFWTNHDDISNICNM